jgi:sensor histidine kinase YesM
VTLQAFIFSNKPVHRLVRHVAFWAAYYLYVVFINLPNADFKTFINTAVYQYAWNDYLRYLPVYLFGVYSVIYFILPRYLAKRNIVFLVTTSALLITLTTLFSYFIAARNHALYVVYRPVYTTGLEKLDTAVQKGIYVFLIISGTAVIVKMMKDYTLRQRESEILGLNGVRNKLRLLKMQMHPAILFDCLQAIRIDMETGFAHASEMVLRLSDLLNYLLYETDLGQVTLFKEVAMMQNYMALKKLEYGNQLRLTFTNSGDMKGAVITPALLLPLMEASIAGVDKTNAAIEVTMNLRTEPSAFYFNSKTSRQGTLPINLPGQVALQQIHQRLQLFYPNRFRLDVYPNTAGFEIRLQLKLNRGEKGQVRAI